MKNRHRLLKKNSKRCTGEQEKYIPLFKCREFHSAGTCENVVDWKNHRTIELMSQGEAMQYRLLRWDDSVIEIKEQFGLPSDETRSIANSFHIPYRYGSQQMSTDLLCTMSDNSLVAYSVKYDRRDLEDISTLQDLFIEKYYWEHKGTPWHLIFGSEIDKQKARNLSSVLQYYDYKYVHDDISLIKHLIATKKISVNLSEELDYPALVNKYLRKRSNGKY